MPILAAAALGLAALVWVAPLPFLKPPTPPEPPPRPATIASSPEQDVEPLVPSEQWESLAAALDALREKTPEFATKSPDIDNPAPPPTPPPQAANNRPPLGWQYRGTIDGPGSRAALITFEDGKSRFVFVGQYVPDINNPTGKPAIIREITTDAVIVDREGDEERVPIQRTELANPLAGRVMSGSVPRRR